jgi:hypothetical protein
MARLSEKYVAGFLDADGSVNVRFQSDCKTPQLHVTFSQKTEQDEVLHLIQRDYGGSINYQMVGDGQYTRLTIGGGRKAKMFLNRIKNFSVLKRRFIEVCLDLCERELDKSEMERVKAYLKAQRKVKSYPIPTYPSRKWLAGYFDGDGCVSATVHKQSKHGGASIRLHITAEDCYVGGIELIHKAFGGSLKPMRTNVQQWYINAPASKIMEMFDYFGKYTVVKRSQVEFILKCAEMGHFRDGNNIVAVLKHLKSHPHRLSEPKPDVNGLLATVKDVASFKWDTHPGKRRLCDSRNLQTGQHVCI